MSHICKYCGEKIEVSEEYVYIWDEGFFHVECLDTYTAKEFLALVDIDIRTEDGD